MENKRTAVHSPESRCSRPSGEHSAPVDTKCTNVTQAHFDPVGRRFQRVTRERVVLCLPFSIPLRVFKISEQSYTPATSYESAPAGGNSGTMEALPHETTASLAHLCAARSRRIHGRRGDQKTRASALSSPFVTNYASGRACGGLTPEMPHLSVPVIPRPLWPILGRRPVWNTVGRPWNDERLVAFEC
jgi:hypothetical protein